MPPSRGRPSDRKPQADSAKPKTAALAAPTPKAQSTLLPLHPLGQKTSVTDSWVRMFLRTLGRTIGHIFRASPQVLLWVSVAMTLIAGGFYFLPRVTVEPSGVYDPKNPSALTFTIGNINIVPIRDVEFGIGLCYIRFPASGDRDRNFSHCNGPASAILHFTPWDIKWLDVDEKYQIALEDFFQNQKIPNQQISNADFTITISYTPWRMPWFWRNTKEFRFVTQERSDGKVYWTPFPLNR